MCRTDGAGADADHWKGKEFNAIIAACAPSILMHIKQISLFWRWRCK
jgi:hypothetical protein